MHCVYPLYANLACLLFNIAIYPRRGSCNIHRDYHTEQIIILLMIYELDISAKIVFITRF